MWRSQVSAKAPGFERKAAVVRLSFALFFGNTLLAGTAEVFDDTDELLSLDYSSKVFWRDPMNVSKSYSKTVSFPYSDDVIEFLILDSF